jgi:FlaG/FlaF family flagellin (archaellin)
MTEYKSFYIILEKLAYGTFNEFMYEPLSFKNYCEYSEKNKVNINILGCVHYFIQNHCRYHQGSKLNKIQKYEKMNNIIENLFISKENKNNYISIISTSINHYLTFNKVAFMWKLKKAKLGCCEDMYMNPIDVTKNKHIEILQEGRKYLFTVSDMIKIVHKSLNNSDELYAEPLPCKNPYNNIPFSKSNLYTIYYAIKKSDYNIPEVFHQYYLSNFSINKFVDNYECMLREKTINIRSITDCDDCLKDDILDMIENYNDCHPELPININDDFPEDILMKAFTPYIKYYYRSLYSLNSTVKSRNNTYWRAALKNFSAQNSQFGRKIIKNKNRQKNTNKVKFSITFNDKLPIFESPCDYNKNYHESHIKTDVVERDFVTKYRRDMENKSRERRTNNTDQLATSFNHLLSHYQNTSQFVSNSTTTINIISNDHDENRTVNTEEGSDSDDETDDDELNAELIFTNDETENIVGLDTTFDDSSTENINEINIDNSNNIVDIDNIPKHYEIN